MSEVKIQTIEQNFDAILEMVGNEPFINWDDFTKNSTEVVKTIDEMNRLMAIFRQIQHKNFIQTMKKLKSLDLPDLITTVKNKKLPKQALRGVLNRFKLNEGKIELVESVEELKENSKKEFESYLEKNKEHLGALSKHIEYLSEKIKDSGFVMEKAPEPKEIKATVKFELSEDKASKLASQVEIQYLPQTHQLVGMKTYHAIVEKSYDLIREEYQKLTYDSRVKQREASKDFPKYLAVMNEYLNNSEALIIAGQGLISKKVGLGEKKLEESEVALMERGLAQNLLMIQSQLRARIKESIPPTKDVSLEVAKEVIVYQTEMISKRSDEIKSILSGLEKNQENVQMIPMLLALILNDMVFEKYGYEEEDFMKNVGEQVIATNPELITIFKEMEVAIIKLMQKLEVIPEEVGKMMEQSAAQRDQMGGMVPPGMQQGMIPPGTMPPPGMVPPGMMPGNNPMQMLQMQQMQQMQQMFGQQPPQQPPK